MTQITEGSLFSGYGGLSLAVEHVYGARTVWTSDIDLGANRILAHRYPDAPNLGDISEVDWSTVERPNILTGGFPCQDVSSAGKRVGMIAGTRSGLWAMMARAVEQLHPDLVVIENVRGLTSARSTDSIVESCAWCVGDGSVPHMRALGVVLGDLADLGYDAQWHGLRAADVGAPHGRYRIFITAHPARNAANLGGQRGRSVRQIGTGDSGPVGGASGHAVENTDQSTSGERWISAPRQAAGGRARADSGGRGRVSDALIPTPTASDWKGSTTGRREPGQHRGQLDAFVEGGTLLPTPRATDGTNGGPNQRGSSGDLMLPSAVLSWGNYAAAIARWEAVCGRAAPAPTEAGKNGSQRLSPRFVEWMMGLPDGWVTGPEVGLTRNQALKALGNGVVPQQAAEALRQLGKIAATY